MNKKYDKNKTTRHVAIIKCKECGEYAISWAGGIFQYCKCKKSFVDQDRWDAYSVRVGGNNVDLIEQICPSTCSYRNKVHKDNKTIESKTELRKYLMSNYNYKLLDEY
jgi:hypothetical protein